MSNGSDARARLDYLQEMGRLLWPPPARVDLTRSRARTDDTAREFLLVAGCRKPRLLLPAENPAASAAVLRMHGEQPSRTARTLHLTVAAAARIGLLGRMPTHRVRVRAPVGYVADDINTYLAGQLGQQVDVSLSLSAARANRKPVLQALDRNGRTLAFVKVGVDALTRGLVDHERAALDTVAAAPLPDMSVPRVIAHGTWRDLGVLLLSPLPLDQRRLQDDGRRHDVAHRLADSGRTQAPLGRSSWWQRLRLRQSRLDIDDEGQQLHRLHSRLEHLAGSEITYFGPAHGDWTRWNAAVTKQGVLVWDWERFDAEAPLGTDVLHFAVQDAIAQGATPARAVTRMLQAAPQLLAPFGLSAAEQALAPALYLLDIGTRYRLDRQLEAGAEIGRIGGWLLPALSQQVEGPIRTTRGASPC